MDLPNTKPNHMTFSLQQKDIDFADHDHSCLISFQQQNQKLADLDEHVSMVDRKGKTSINFPVSSTTRKKSGGSSGGGGGGGGGDGAQEDRTQKKMVHREIERQRRQEMAKLYASLRDLLPLEFIKGNRSISDHMHQAVHYITQMEKNVKALSMKRDNQLKKFSNTDENSTNNTVSVTLCNEGVEILINSCLIEEGFMLSGVLKALVEEGHNITSCSLTKVNNRLLHSILTEASDVALIDLSVLQQRLVLVANAQANFN